MKSRIAIWAAVGAFVVVFWTLYISVMGPVPRGVTWSLALLTCPLAFAQNYALSFYFVFLVNTAAYALAGIAVETIRWPYRTRLTPI
jgi:hypothetical protein